MCQTFSASEEQRGGNLYLRVRLIVELLRSDPSAHQVVPHRVRQGEVVIPGGRDVSVFHQSEVQVAIEALLQLCNILHSHDPPDADLLALLLVGEWGRHARAGSSVLGREGGLKRRLVPAGSEVSA